MARAFILLADSVGCGGGPDAADFVNIDVETGETILDTGSDTLGHLAQWREAQGQPLHLPNLAGLGLGLTLCGGSLISSPLSLSSDLSCLGFLFGSCSSSYRKSD